MTEWYEPILARGFMEPSDEFPFAVLIVCNKYSSGEPFSQQCFKTSKEAKNFVKRFNTSPSTFDQQLTAMLNDRKHT